MHTVKWKHLILLRSYVVISLVMMHFAIACSLLLRLQRERVDVSVFSPPFTWRNGRGLGDVTGWAGLSRLIVKKRIVAVVVVVV